MKNVEYNANRMKICSIELEFKYNISQIEYNNGVYLVLLEIPKGSKEVDNLYGVNENGKICWRVQSAKDVFDLSQNTPYISLDIVDNGVVKVTNFFGLRFTLNSINGKLIEKECIRW